MPNNPTSSVASLMLLACLTALAPDVRAQPVAVDAGPDAIDTQFDYQVTRINGADVPLSSDSEKSTPQWLSMYNLNGRWPGGTMQWYFNPANIPVGLSADQVLAILQKAAAKWEGMCNFKFQFMGRTTQGIDIRPTPVTNDGMNVWGFDNFEPALAKYAGYAPTQVISYLDGRPATIVQGDIKFNKDQYWTVETLEGVATHEIGHAIGIGHSDNPQSVMSATPYHGADYTKVLRGDDATACSALYDEAPTQWTNRILNWAEATFPLLFKSTAELTQQAEGYTYRYYPKTNAYAGSKEGRAYYMGADRVMQDFGQWSNYMHAAILAGF